jgi:hypothetical protein
MYYCYICYHHYAGIDSYVPETNHIYRVQSFAPVISIIIIISTIIVKT